MREQEGLLRRTAALLKSSPKELPERVARLLEERREAQREIDELRAGGRGESTADLASQAREIRGVKVVAGRVDGADAKSMRSMVDDLRNRLGSAVVMLAAETGGKALVAVGVTPDLTESHQAGALVRSVAKVVGGGGGGRPDFAQAGGKNIANIDEAIEKFYALMDSN